MKLLLDQNLSRKIILQLRSTFPGSCHLTAVLPETADDQTIWDYAAENDFVIVTKDDDFERRSVLFGHPPKVVWLRIGNCTTAQVLALLNANSETIEAFAQDQEKSILAVV